ncbi:MAG: hypothetical protein HY518_02320 [Candidatus Aenigmarchaeota archaeon]|nr:hypothetical protein [Candidatus Aenigmarchaeota archaeon]
MPHESKVSKYVNPPFIEPKQFGNLLKLPLYFAIRETGRLIRDYGRGIRQEAHQTGEKAPGAYLLETLLGENLYEWGSQSTDAIITNAIPKIDFWRRWAHGITNIEKIYTVTYRDAEIPVFIKKRGGVDPTPEVLTQNIEYVLNYNMSIYNYLINLDLEFYERKVAEKTLNKYSRGDYENRFVDPDRFRKWLVRDEVWYIQQFGREMFDEERDVGVRGTQYRIKVYEKPEKGFSNWAYWFLGDQLYDFIDIPYDRIQRLVEIGQQVAGVPVDVMETLTEFEYRGIAAARRGMSYPLSPRVNSIEFDLRGPQGRGRPEQGQIPGEQEARQTGGRRMPSTGYTRTNSGLYVPTPGATVVPFNASARGRNPRMDRRVASLYDEGLQRAA